ncbi:WD repeat-containing protein 75 [Chytriomyces hyalinus]|nr:WD repeat-containing protein 75 [Chytriomyces hyalinus]
MPRSTKAGTKETEPCTSSTVLCGGVPSSLRVVFVGGGKLFCAATASTVNVMSVENGMRVHALVGHGAEITGMVAHPSNEFLIYSASLDSTVKLWDVSDGSLIKTWTFKEPVTLIASDPSTPEAFYLAFTSVADTSNSTPAASTTPKKKDSRATVEKFLLKLLETEDDEHSKLRYPRPLEIIFSNRMPFKALHASAGLVAVCTDQKIWVKGAGIDDEPKRLNLPNKQYATPPKIMTLACHPTTALVSAGLSSGEILMFHNSLHEHSLTPSIQSHHQTALQILHWHANPVTALSFSNDGTTLFSGGLESVIVLWQVETLKRRFIPRIGNGSPLLSLGVSPDDRFVGVVCGDASVRIVGVADLAVKTSVVGLKSKGKRVLNGNALVKDPRSGMMVVAGSSGCLQFYDVWGDVNVMEVEAVAQNRIVGSTGGSSEDSIVGEDALAAVKLVAFEREGKQSRWMATLDERAGMTVGGEPEVSLKFWMWDDVNQVYSVYTRVTSPHDGEVTSMHFVALPNEETGKKTTVLITTSLDARFKMWELAAVDSSARDVEPNWVQRSQGFYRDSPIYDAATSADASMLAIAAGSVISLWDPATNIMCATLCHPHSEEHVLKVAFSGSESDVPCLIGITASRCYVWNLLTGSVWWSVDLGGVGNGLSVDSETGRFVVSAMVHDLKDAGAEDSGVELDGVSSSKKKAKKALAQKTGTPNTRILEFHPSSPLPTWIHVAPGKVHGLSYAPSEHAPSLRAKHTSARVLIMSSTFEIEVVGAVTPKGAVPSSEVSSKPAAVTGATPSQSLFSGIYGAEAFQDPTSTIQKAAESAKRDSTLQSAGILGSEMNQRLSFMDTASHLMLAPVKLALPFFDAILKKRDSEQESLDRTAWDLGASHGSANGVSDEMDEDIVVQGNEEREHISTEATFKDVEGLEFLGDVFKGMMARKDSGSASGGAMQAKLLTITKSSPVATSTPTGNGVQAKKMEAKSNSKLANGSTPVGSASTPIANGSAKPKATAKLGEKPFTPVRKDAASVSGKPSGTPSSASGSAKKSGKLSAKKKSA